MKTLQNQASGTAASISHAGRISVGYGSAEATLVQCLKILRHHHCATRVAHQPQCACRSPFWQRLATTIAPLEWHISLNLHVPPIGPDLLRRLSLRVFTGTRKNMQSTMQYIYGEKAIGYGDNTMQSNHLP